MAQEWFRSMYVRSVMVIVPMLACSSSWGSTTETGTKDDDNFREDVFACEDAVARLETCSDAFPSHQLLCTHRLHDYSWVESGCMSSERGTVFIQRDPVFSAAESQCIRATSCEGLRTTGVCARASEVTQRFVSRYTTSGKHGPAESNNSLDHEPVCQ